MRFIVLQSGEPEIDTVAGDAKVLFSLSIECVSSSLPTRNARRTALHTKSYLEDLRILMKFIGNEKRLLMAPRNGSTVKPNARGRRPIAFRLVPCFAQIMYLELCTSRASSTRSARTLRKHLSFLAHQGDRLL